MENESNKLATLIEENRDDLVVFGLFFLRLLESDFHVMSVHPSGTLVAVLELEQQGNLGTKKDLLTLFSELRRTGWPILTDGSGGSILRL